MRSVVTLASTLVIHPSVRVPDHCGVCAMWNDMEGKQIIHPATRFAQWEDAQGPDNYIGICDDCRMSGFEYIGTIDEFKAAQRRAMGIAEYEVYARGYTHDCLSRPDACARIRSLIGNGVSIEAVYYRSPNTGRLNKLNRDDQARIVIEAMSDR